MADYGQELQFGAFITPTNADPQHASHPSWTPGLC